MKAYYAAALPVAPGMDAPKLTAAALLATAGSVVSWILYRYQRFDVSRLVWLLTGNGAVLLGAHVIHPIGGVHSIFTVCAVVPFLVYAWDRERAYVIGFVALPLALRNYIERVHYSANALLGIINDILDFSKIEAGKLELEHTSFTLDKVLENLSTLLAPKAAERDIELLVGRAPDVPTDLVGDPLRLGQVLLNLAGNAVKFTDEDGVVDVKVNLGRVNEDRAELLFTVRDTGIGMSEEVQSRLYQSFTQADGSTTRQYGGTGLGLSISQSLVRMMGGRISASSVEGQGSTLSFSLPFDIDRSHTRAPRAMPSDLQGRRVLVADDHVATRDFLGEIMGGYGFEVLRASRGIDAVSMTVEEAEAGRPIDLVLMDWRMPGIDGIKAWSMIREGLSSNELPKVILVTAHGREDVIQRAKDERIDDFLVKPLNVSTLIDPVLELFGKERAAVAETEATGEDPATLLEDIRGARILLVEDHAINRELAVELLEHASLVVEVAHDGQEAVNAVEERQFDGILMDIQMPVMNGYEATKRIRQLDGREGLQIVAMTANAIAGERQKCLDAGIDGYISKPIDVRELHATLRDTITLEKTPVLEASPVDESFSDLGDGNESGELTESRLGQLEHISSHAALSRLAGNMGLYQMVLRSFLEDCQTYPNDLQAALQSGDAETGERLAHTFKGLAGAAGAEAVQEAAFELEKPFAKGRLDDAERAYQNVCARQQWWPNSIRCFSPAESFAPRISATPLRAPDHPGEMSVQVGPPSDGMGTPPPSVTRSLLCWALVARLFKGGCKEREISQSRNCRWSKSALQKKNCRRVSPLKSGVC